MLRLNSAVVQGIALNNLSSIAQQPAMLSNLAYSNAVFTINLSMQNAVAFQQALNQLGLAILGKTVNGIANFGPMQAQSAGQVLTGNALVQEIADLRAAIEKLLKARGIA